MEVQTYPKTCNLLHGSISSPRLLGLIATVFFSLFAQSLSAQQPAPATSSTEKLVYVIPIQDEIESSLTYLVRRGVKEALENKASVLILHMHTPGGRVSDTEEIIRIINRFQPEVETYTYVDTQAFSAGSFIAASTRHIYMAPSSVIGAAAPIMIGADGSPAQLGETIQKKISSGLRALVRAQAEKNGHNTAVFDAMVDKDMGLKINGVEICPQGQILTLTNREAEKEYGSPSKKLLSEGTVASLDALIKKVAPGARVVTVQANGWESLARLITLISPALLSLALLLGYLEFKLNTGGLLISIAVVLGIIFFFGHYVAGLTGYESVLIFGIGILLILVELLILPGSAVFGMLGLFCILLSLLRAMIDIYPTDPIIPSASAVAAPLGNLLLAISLAGGGIILLTLLLPFTPVYRHLALTTVNDTPTDPTPAALQVGAIGVAQTQLRPSGRALFEQTPVDVLTDGQFIEPGTPIKIVAIHGSKISVEPQS